MSNAQDKTAVSEHNDNSESVGSSIELQSMSQHNESYEHEHSTESNEGQENLFKQVSHEEDYVTDNKVISNAVSPKAVTPITRESLSTRMKLWLLASKGIWFILGSVLVLIAGLVSHFGSKALPATDNCTNTTTANYTL